MSDRNEILERLNDVHSFPGGYIFKVIGENSDEFVTRIVQASLNVLGPDANPDVSTRESSGGKHVSVTLEVRVEDAEMVLEIYDMLGQLDGIKFIL
jgi:putative lipoic acid-binding regulatory protein